MSAGHPKNRYAAHVSATIRTAMARHGLTAQDVADRTGFSVSMIRYWTAGRYLPSVEAGERLAHELRDDSIFTLTKRAHVGRCELASCGRVFHRIWRGGHRKFCSPRCRDRANDHPDERRDPRQDAIDAFCASCEPEGLCRVAECELRPYSPLPFIPLHELRSVS